MSRRVKAIEDMAEGIIDPMMAMGMDPVRPMVKILEHVFGRPVRVEQAQAVLAGYADAMESLMRAVDRYEDIQAGDQVVADALATLALDGDELPEVDLDGGAID